MKTEQRQSHDASAEISEAEYTEAITKKAPRRDDSLDIAIVKKIKQCILRERWARDAFTAIRKRQIEYLREVLAKSDDDAFVYTRTQEVLAEFAGLLRAEIEEGMEHLAEIQRGRPVILATNHLSAYKLTGFDPKRELGVAIQNYDFITPSPMFIAGFVPASKALGDNLSYVSDDFPGVFGRIHRAAGFVHVPPKETLKTGRTAYLLEQTRETFRKRQDTALVNFPEGQTSGKHEGLGPYDLAQFKTGGYVIAADLKTRVVPIAQYFDPRKGMRLKVFPSYIIPESTVRNVVQRYADKDRGDMQKWLNKKRGEQME
jgi:hypothetical protein